MTSRKPHTFRLKPELVKKLKHIAIELGLPFNVLLEEGIIYIIRKYENVLGNVKEGENKVNKKKKGDIFDE